MGTRVVDFQRNRITIVGGAHAIAVKRAASTGSSDRGPSAARSSRGGIADRPRQIAPIGHGDMSVARGEEEQCHGKETHYYSLLRDEGYVVGQKRSLFARSAPSEIPRCTAQIAPRQRHGQMRLFHVQLRQAHEHEKHDFVHPQLSLQNPLAAETASSRGAPVCAL